MELKRTRFKPFPRAIHRFFEHIYLWYEAFRNKLLEEGIAYQGMLYRQAAEQIHLKSIPYKEVWFVGLNALTTSEKQIIQHLKNMQKAKLFWDADAHYVENQVHEAGMFMRQHHHEWGGVFPQKLLEQQKKIRIIGCAKNVGKAGWQGKLYPNLTRNP